MLTSWFGKFSLKTVLIVPFVLQTVTAVGFVGYFSYKNGQQAVEDLATQLTREVSLRIEDRLDNYLQTPQEVVAANYLAWQQGTLDITDLEAVREQFWQQIKLHPLLAGVYFLNTDKETIGYGRISSEGMRELARKITGDDLPIGTLYLGESRKPNLTQRKFYVLDQTGKSQQLFYALKIDYRTLPWYQQAIANQKQSWSSIVPYQAAPILGMFSVAPIYDNAGQLQAVFAANFALADISAFLNQLNFSPSGQAFIVDHSGYLVATSTLEKLSTQPAPDQLQPILASQSQDVRTREITQQLKQRFGNFQSLQTAQQLSLVSEGQKLFVKVLPYRDEYGLDWLIVVTVPASDFMARIYENTRLTILLCIATLIATTGIGMMTAQLITKPILQLNAAAKNLAQGDFIPLIPNQNLKEMGELTTSFNQMVASLQDSFKSLKESEKRFSTLLETVPVGVSVFDATGQLVMINEAGRKMLGQGVISGASATSISELYQVYYAGTDQLYPNDQLPSVLAFQGKTAFANNIEVHRADGKIVPLEVWATPVFDEAKNVIYTINAFVDITERKQAQELIENYNRTLEKQVQERTEALQHSEAQINAFLTSAPVGMAIVNSQLQFVRVNKTLAKIDGFSVEELLGKTIREAVPKLADIIEPLYQQVLATGQAILNQEVRGEVPSTPGLQRDWLVSYFPIFKANSRVENVGVVVVEISELKQAEAALIESESKFSTIFHSSPDPAWIATLAEGRCFNINESLVRFLGYSYKEIIGKTCRELQLWDNIEDWHYFQKMLTEQGSLHNFETVFRIGVGESKTVLLSAKVIKINEQDCILGVLKDISERKQMEVALAQEVLRNKALLDASIDGIVVIDQQGNVIEANSSFARMIGYSLEETTTLNLADFEAHWTAAEMETKIDEQDFCTNRFETRHRRKDGSIYDVEISANSVNWQGQEVHFCVCRDITSRKQLELALKTSESRLRSVLNHAPAFISGVRLLSQYQWEYEYFSPGIEAIYGYTGEAIAADPSLLLSLIVPEDIETIVKPALEQFYTPNFSTTLEYRLRHRDGSIRWVANTLSTHWDETAQAWYGTGIIIDITDRKQAEAALQHSETRLQQLASASPGVIYTVVEYPEGPVGYEYLSPAFETIHEVSIAEVKNNPAIPFEQIHPDDRAGYQQAVADTIANNQVFKHEWRIITPSGKTKWIQAHSRLERRDNGEIVWHGIVLEITEQKQAEVALKQKTQEVEHFFAGALDLLCIANTDGYFLRLNPEWENTLGYPLSELENRCFLDFVHPDDLQSTVDAMANLSAQNPVVFFTNRYRHQNGSYRWIEWRSLPLGDLVYATARDITERKQAEEILKITLARLQNLATAAPGNIYSIVLHSDGSITFEYTNQAIEEILELKLEEILQDAGGVILRQMHPDDRQGYLAAVAHSAETLERFQHEWRIITPSGKLKWVQGSSQPERRENGDIVWHGIILDISDRKFAEEAVQESAARLRSFFDSASVMMGIVELYPDDILHLADNLTTAQFFGTTPEAMQNRLASEMGVPPTTLEMWLHYYRQAQQTGHPVRFEYLHQDPDGEKWLSVSVSQISNSASGRPRFSYIAENINDRKAAEVALRESEARFRNLFENSPVAYQSLDAEGRYIDVNDELCHLLGYTREELLGRQFGECWPPEKQPLFSKKFAGFKANGFAQAELCLVTKQGKSIIVLLKGRVQYDLEGRFLKTHCTLYDITDRKQAEEAIKAARERLELVIHASQDGFWDWDFVTGEIYFSPRFKEMLGYADHEFPNHISAWENAIFEEDRIAALKLVEDYNVGRVPQFLATQRFHHKNGSTVYILSRAIHLKNEQGNVIRMIGAHTDITNLKQAEAALQNAVLAADAANRAKSEFLASMSHELRTPLNAILGFSQIMSQDRKLSAEHQNHISIINRAGEHLLTLINDILEVSKIEAGRTTFNESSFDLLELLESLDQLLQLKANSKGLQLIFNYETGLPQYVKTDEGKLRQILLNLLGNAIKFTQVGYVKLRVSPKYVLSEATTLTEDQTSKLYFEIEDTGPGISPEEMHFLFEAFGQTKTGRDSQQGTGLGLPISQKYVNLLGGEITVSSTPNQGSIFAFDIDVRSADPEFESVQIMRQYQKVTHLAPAQPQYRILIVDDIAESRLFLAKILTSIGFLVCESVNGEEAVQSWKTWHPHLILMDMKMPVMDGYEAVKIIRSEEQTRLNLGEIFDKFPEKQAQGKTVIFALTASAFEEERYTILAAGCDDFMGKPLQVEFLLEKITQHLGVQYKSETEDLTTETLQPASESLSENDLLPQLSQMPVNWVCALNNAASGCSDDMVLELLKQIPENNMTLINYLRNLAENFQFIEIIQLTNKILRS
jgi:PAS domain S-box-containing protein